MELFHEQAITFTSKSSSANLLFFFFFFLGKSGDGGDAAIEGLYSIKIVAKPHKAITSSPFHDMTLLI